MLILGTLCTRGRSGLPAGDALRQGCPAPRLAPQLQPKCKHMGEEAFAAPSPADTTCRITQPGITRKNKRGDYRRGMAAHILTNKG